MASTQGETKLKDRKEKGDRVFYEVAHPDRADGLQWLVLERSEPGFIAMEKAYDEDANVVIEVFDESATPDLENMPTMFFGWAYIQVQKTAKKNWLSRKAVTGRISFADF